MEQSPIKMITRDTPYGDLPDYLTPQEFAEYLGLGRTTMYDLLRRGDVAHVRFGRQIRIPKSALAIEAHLR